MSAIANFISELIIHFPKRFDSDNAERFWVESMKNALKGYDPKIIAQAGKDIIDTRTERSFPLPAECKKACYEAHKRLKGGEPTLNLERNITTDYEWQYRLADELIECDLGRQAAREGWVLSLHDFIRRERRLPASGEIQGIKRQAKGFDEAYQVCLRGKGGVANASLLKLGGMMLARREALRGRLLGANS